MDAPGGHEQRAAAPTPSPAHSKGGGLGVKLFLALVVLGLGAAGVVGIKTYIEKRQESGQLEEEGVETDATVISVTEISGRRVATHHRVSVSFDADGSGVSVAEVIDCPDARYESGTDTVSVVYLPDDPEVVRLAACAESFDANVLPGILGVVFLGLAGLLLWRVRWRD